MSFLPKYITHIYTILSKEYNIGDERVISNPRNLAFVVIEEFLSIKFLRFLSRTLVNITNNNIGSGKRKHSSVS